MLWAALLFLWLSPLYAALVAFLAGNSRGPLTATGGVLLGGAVAMVSWNIGLLTVRDAVFVADNVGSWGIPFLFLDAFVGVLIVVAIFVTRQGWRRRALLAIAGAIAGLQIGTVAVPIILGDAQRFFVLLATAAFNGFLYPYWALVTLFFCFFVSLKNQRLRSSEGDAPQPTYASAQRVGAQKAF